MYLTVSEYNALNRTRHTFCQNVDDCVIYHDGTRQYLTQHSNMCPCGNGNFHTNNIINLLYEIGVWRRHT